MRSRIWLSFEKSLLGKEGERVAARCVGAEWRRRSAYTVPNSIASIPAKTNVEAEEACGLATELKIKQILLGFDLGNICMNNFCTMPKPLNVTTLSVSFSNVLAEKVVKCIQNFDYLVILFKDVHQGCVSK